MNSKTLPYLLLAPATIFLVVFFLWPFLQIAWLAFTTDGGFTMQHFQTMASNWKFWPTFWNTIILAGQPVRQVLDEQAATLRALMTETGAPCWLPDAPSEGPCPVE